jgi:hypothetical protein
MSGGIIYAKGAGAVVIGYSILTTQKDQQSKEYTNGLNILEGDSIYTPYDASKKDQTHCINLSNQIEHPIIALPKNSTIIADSNYEGRAIGDPVIIFGYGKHWEMRKGTEKYFEGLVGERKAEFTRRVH